MNKSNPRNADPRRLSQVVKGDNPFISKKKSSQSVAGNQAPISGHQKYSSFV